MLKSANYNTIQNKSETVTNVLSDNIKMSEEKFIKKSELLLSECNKFLLNKKKIKKFNRFRKKKKFLFRKRTFL